MWAFTTPNAGPLGARNREQVLPLARGWTDAVEQLKQAATPGSACSTQKKVRLPSALRQRANESVLTSGLHKQQASPSTTLPARPQSASAGPRAAAPSLATRPVSAVQARRGPTFSSAPDIHTPSGTLLSVNHPPGAARAEKWMAQMKADGYMLSPTASCYGASCYGSPSHKSMGTPMSTMSHKSMYSPMNSGYLMSQDSSRFSSRPQSPVAKLRRNRTAPTLEISSQAGSREHTPEHAAGPGARRLRGSVVGSDTSSRGQKYRSRPGAGYGIREAPVKLTSHTTVVAAFEVDRLYQEGLQSEWRKELDEKSLAQTLSIKRRQTIQFFDFLRDPETDDLIEGGERYVPEQLQGENAIQADWSKSEVFRDGPELEYSDVIEFDGRQVESLRKVLRSFAMVSRPAGKVSRKLLDDGGPCADRLFRPTFARFLIDARLVQGTGSSQPDGYQPFHRTVRIFDSVSNNTKTTVGQDHVFVQQVGPTLCSLRSVTTEQCISIVGALIGKAENPANALKDFFEKDLPEAQKVVQALLTERKERVEAAIKVVKADMLEEGYATRRQELMSLFGSPPTTYSGSMKDWIRGMKQWIQMTDDSSQAEAIAERVESNFAVEHYLEDMLVEPGTIHVAEAYAFAFQALFASYYDEERTCWIFDPVARTMTESRKPHMSAAAFFRFCVDFSVYPFLGSFDEIRAAYVAVDSVDELPGIMEMERMKKRYKTPEALLAAMQGRKPSTACDEQGFPLEGGSGDEDIEEDGDIFEDEHDEEDDDRDSEHAEKSPMKSNMPGSKGRPLTATSRQSKAEGDLSLKGEASSKSSKNPTPTKESSLTKDFCTMALAHVGLACTECGNIFKTDSAFCRKCGKERPGQVQQPTCVCGNVFRPDAVFCRKCGKKRPAEDKSPKKEPEKLKSSEKDSSNILAPTKSQLHGHRLSVRNSADAKHDAEAAQEAVAKATAEGALSGADNKSKIVGRRSSAAGEVSSPPRRKSLESSASKSDQGTQDDGVPVRVKTCIDLTWVRKPFASMTEHERRAYALLSAFSNCVADRFLCVRGLFLSCCEGGELGLVNAADIRRTLDKLKFEHDFTEEDMEAFVNVLDPNAEEGLVETAEIEKAVGKVKTDTERRWPWLKEVGIGQTNEKGSSSDLGDDIRNHDDEDCWFQRERKTRNVTAFGSAAFTEAIMRVGLSGLHGSGMALQATAPAGIKGLYVTSFLRFHYERLREMRSTVNFDALDPKLHTTMGKRQAGMEGQASSTPSSQVSTRPGTAASRPDTASSNAARGATSPAASGQHWTSAYFAQLGNTAPPPTPMRPDRRNEVLTKGGPPPTPTGAKGQRPPREEEEPPSGAKYQWALNRLLDKHPDLFKKGMSMSTRKTDEAPYIVNPYKAFESCSQCNRSRDARGRGNLFCHECSGIDDAPLSRSLLYRACQRRRVRIRIAQAAGHDASAFYSAAEGINPDDLQDALSKRDLNGVEDGSVSDNQSRSESKDGPREGQRSSAASNSGSQGQGSRRPSKDAGGSRQGSRRSSIAPESQAPQPLPGSRRNSIPGVSPDSGTKSPQRRASLVP